MMASAVRDLAGARDLVWAWTGRTIRGRYQQSVLGWLWAVVQPAATVTIFTLIFTRIVPIDTGEIPYPIFAYVAMVPWTFLGASLTDMSMSLIQNMNLVTKIYFPREALPIAAMLARLLDFAVASGLLILLMVYFQVSIFPLGLLYLPVILSIQMLLILGLGLAAAALNIFSRDIQPLLALVVQLWFYASPIIYPVDRVPEALQPYYFLNPMAGILEAYRDVLLRQQVPDSSLAVAAGIASVVFLAGYWLFKRVEFLFADVV